MDAGAAKDNGNAAWRAGDFEGAVTWFSKALDLDPNNDQGGNHVFYSNRSAAQLSLNRVDEALADAKLAVKAKPDWPRGHSRKGAALHRKGRYQAAMEAYRNGLALDPDNAAMQEALAASERADRRARGVDDSGGSSAPAPAPAASAPAPAPAASITAFVKRDIHGAWKFAVRGFILFNALMYLVPVFGYATSAAAYSRALKVTIMHYLVMLYEAYGFPKFNKEYLVRVMQNPATMMVFYVMLFLAQRPYALALVPVLLGELAHFAWYLSQLLAIAAPGARGALAAQTDKLLAAATGNGNFARLAERQKWAAVNQNVPRWAAMGEVAIGLALVIELLTPYRNLLLLVLYWQFMRVRYMISDPVKAAFGQVHRKLQQLSRHRMCPGLVARGYDKVSGWLSSMGEMPTQEQAAASTSRCTVM